MSDERRQMTDAKMTDKRKTPPSNLPPQAGGGLQNHRLTGSSDHRSSYLMPAEWEKQTATWFGWPHNPNDWPDRFGPIPWVYVDIMRHITRVQQVHILVKNEKHQHHASAMLDRAGVELDQVHFHIFPTDRGWTRDSGPIFVRVNDALTPTLSQRERGKLAIIDFKFNGWAKYPNHKKDEKLPAFAGQALNLPVVTPHYIHKGKSRAVVLEGGAIDVNGKGSILTTEECLLSTVQKRNPGMNREDYEALFAEYLGATHTIWLGHGIAGDDTHGHVDDLARFVNATTVVTVVEKDKRDVNYAALQDNLKRLKKAKDERGRPLNVVELPMPQAIVFEGERLPASYANFLIANRLVLVPTFNDARDREALSILAECFPKHDVVGIHCGDFIWGLGTIHCASQQQPL